MIKVEVVKAVMVEPKESMMDILGIRWMVAYLTIATQWVNWHLSTTGRKFRGAKVSPIYTFKNEFLTVEIRGQRSLYVRALPVDRDDAPVWDGFDSVVTLGDILHFLVHQDDRRGHYIFKAVNRRGKVAIVAAHTRRGRWVLEALPEHYPYFWMVRYRTVTR